MSDTPRVNVSAVNTCSLLGVLFVGLKLTGHIAWPWIWVLSPFWLPLATVLTLAVIAAIVYVFVSILSNK